MGIESRSNDMMSISARATSDWHKLMEAEIMARSSKQVPKQKTINALKEEIEDDICGRKLPTYVDDYQNIYQDILGYIEQRNEIQQNSDAIAEVGGDTFETDQEVFNLNEIIEQDLRTYNTYKPIVHTLLNKCDELKRISDCEKNVCNPNDVFAVWKFGDARQICKC